MEVKHVEKLQGLKFANELRVFICVLANAPRTLCQRNIQCSFVSMVRPTVHTNPSQKWKELENASFTF